MRLLELGIQEWVVAFLGAVLSNRPETAVAGSAREAMLKMDVWFVRQVAYRCEARPVPDRGGVSAIYMEAKMGDRAESTRSRSTKHGSRRKGVTDTHRQDAVRHQCESRLGGTHMGGPNCIGAWIGNSQDDRPGGTPRMHRKLVFIPSIIERQADEQENTALGRLKISVGGIWRIPPPQKA